MWPIDSIVEKPANGYFLRDPFDFAQGRLS